MTHYVYFAWDAQKRCLYVGCTNNLTRRMKEHANLSTSWVRQTALMSVLSYPNRKIALEVESRQIAKLRPVHNIRDNPAYLTVAEAMEREQWSIDFDDLNGDARSRAAYLARNPDASGNLRRWIAMQNLRDKRAVA